MTQKPSGLAVAVSLLTAVPIALMAVAGLWFGVWLMYAVFVRSPVAGALLVLSPAVLLYAGVRIVSRARRQVRLSRRRARRG